MTRTFSSDANNDLVILSDGNLSISSGLDAVLNAAQTAAQAQLGEMVLSIDTGVPNFQTVWSSATNVAQFEAYVRRAILSVDGVKEISEFSVDVRDNQIFYTANIVSTFGVGNISNG